jgi:type I restriction enzyme S subunit
MDCKPKLRFSEFKENWNLRKIGDFAKIEGGGTPDTKNPKYWNGNLNWFTPTEVGKNKYVFSSDEKITE